MKKYTLDFKLQVVKGVLEKNYRKAKRQGVLVLADLWSDIGYPYMNN